MAEFGRAYRGYMENRMRSEDFRVLEERILCASREKRREERQCAANRRSRFVKRALACICAVAVAGGTTWVYCTTVQRGKGGRLSLSVYSTGTEGVTPAVATQKSAGVRGFNFDGAERVTEFGRHRVVEDFTLDFSCRGENIKRLKYEISGGASFALSGSGGGRKDPYEYLPKEQTFSSFFAQPGDDLSRYRIHVEAPVSASEEARLMAEKNGALSAKESGASAPSHTVAELKINNRLNGTVISVTAALTDGTVKTVRYQLSAVKDYQKAVQAYSQKAKELERVYYTPNDADQKREKEYEQKLAELDRKTKFYCITELE